MAKKNTKEVLVLIPASVFAAASEESKKTVPVSTILDAHLRAGVPGVVQPDPSYRPPWRTLLQSPLGSFLAGSANRFDFIQLAGHVGGFVPGTAGTICKKADDLERAALEELMLDPLKPMVPLFYKEVRAYT